MLPILGFALLLRAQSAITLGSYVLAGQTIQAELPSDPESSVGTDSTLDGWTYRVPKSADSQTGFDIERMAGKGGWDDLARLWARRAPKPVGEWRTRIVLFAYTDILDQSKGGVLRERRSGFLGPDRHEALQSIALLGSMIEAYSGGKLSFAPQVDIEEDPMRFDSPAEKPYDDAFVRRYFQPRINGGYFEADDHVYRGPYNSVFFLHSGLTDASSFTSIYDTPVSGLPLFFAGENVHPGELAKRMFNEWCRQLRFDLARHGYQVGPVGPPDYGALEDGSVHLRLPQGLMTDAMWAVAANCRETSDYASHFPARDGAPVPWSKAKESPWTLLSKLDAGKVAAASGAEQADVSKAIDADHSIELVAGPGQNVALAEPELADFVAGGISDDPQCLGFVNGISGPKIVFEEAAGATLKFSLPTPTLDVSDGYDFKSGDPKLPVYGERDYKIVDDPDQGKAAWLEDIWVTRAGGLVLFRFGNGRPKLDSTKAKYLDLLVKPVAGAFSLKLEGETGAQVYDLFAPTSPPAESNQAPPKLLALKADGGWQHAIVPLDGVGELRAIDLTAGNEAFWPISLDQKTSIKIASANLLASASPTPIVVPDESADATSSDPAARIRFAIKADERSAPQVAALLKDTAPDVELNAANAFTRIKYAPAEDALADLAHKLDPRLAEVAMVALLSQGTDTARGVLLGALSQGPFDGNKYFAGLLLSTQKDTNLEQFYGLLIVSRSWETRLLAVQAMSLMPGQNAQKYLLGMLEETNPEIEATIAQRGSTEWEDFDKRMEWYAVNDPSDWMRAWSNIALIESKLPAYPFQGLKGLKDDSWTVRSLILGYLGQHPNESMRSAVLASLADASPEVRASALRALANFAPTNLNELGRVTMDTDPRVQLALVALAQKEKLELPAEANAQLKNSPDPGVAEQARKSGKY